ncbi:hypothetical protein [Endozoicomonas acroporae]|uniref:hypothetical protein n=1 Tax=Endozoicomonas acroporae TaxID=1701104 RepID=UPI003D79072A
MTYPNWSPLPSTSQPVATADQLPLPPDQQAACSAEVASFDARHATLALSERLQLKYQGYSDQEICAAEKTLQQRSTEPLTVDRILQELTDRRVDITTTLNSLDAAVDKTPGTNAKLRLASQVMNFAQSLKKRVDCVFNQHFSAAWPDRQKVAEMVSQWPESLKESAIYIRYGWPVLKVGRGVDILCDFRSAMQVCNSPDDQYEGLHPKVHPDLWGCFDPGEFKDYSDDDFRRAFKESAPKYQALIRNLPADFPVISRNAYLDYPVFFRLVREIWLDAIHTRNTGTMERISHLMVSFTDQINRNSHRFGSYNNHIKALDDQLACSYSMKYEELSVLPFLLATHPRRWNENYSSVSRRLIHYALSDQESKLKTCPVTWGADLTQQLSICYWVESKLIPDTIMTLRFLSDIVQYIDKDNRRFGSGTLSDQVYWTESGRPGRYFDKETHQLLSPIIATDPQTLYPMEETRQVLTDFFSRSIGTIGATPANG